MSPVLLPSRPRPPEAEPGAEPSPPPTPEASPSPSPAPSPAPSPEEPGTGGAGAGGGGGGNGPSGDSGGDQDPQVPEEIADCGALEVSCHVSNWFYDLVTAGLEPLMGWLGSRAFHTPQPSSGVESLWEGVLGATSVLYVLAILAGGVIVMGHETMHQRYSAREILPRLVIGFVAAHASLWISTEMIRGANGIAAGIADLGIDAGRAATRFQKRLDTLLLDATVFVLLMLVVVVVLLVVWCVMEAVRIAATITLVIAAPLLLAFHALPYTQRLASLWWRCMAGVLAMPIAQSLAFMALMRVAFQGEAYVIGEGNEDWLVNLALLLTVLYIQIRVPFWIMRLVWQNNVGSSPLAAAVRTAVMALVFRKVLPGRGGAAAGAAGRGGGGAGARGGRRPVGRGPGGGGTRSGAASGRGGPAPQGRSSRDSGPSPRGAGASSNGSAAPAAVGRSGPASGPRMRPTPSSGSGREGDSPAEATTQGGPVAPSNSSEGRPVQMSLFARPRRWRQGVLPTPPPTRVPGRRATQRWGVADAGPAEERPVPQAGRGQQALFPAPRTRAANRPTTGRPRGAEPPPAPRNPRRRTTQRWGDAAPTGLEQEPRRPGPGQQPLFATPPRPTPPAEQAPRRQRSSPSAQPRPEAPARRAPANPRGGPARRARPTGEPTEEDTSG